MKIYIDSEFIDDGKTIDLISIGLVSEDGRELYLQHSDFIASRASPWVKEHVFPSLSVCPNDAKDPDRLNSWHYGIGECQLGECPWRTRQEIADEIYTFLDADEYGKPEIISWCGGFDFVAFCQLFGTMMDLPSSFPHYFKDLQYALDERGIPDHDLPVQEGATHNALSDAKYIKLVWEAVVNPLYRSEWSIKENL